MADIVHPEFPGQVEAHLLERSAADLSNQLTGLRNLARAGATYSGWSIGYDDLGLVYSQEGSKRGSTQGLFMRIGKDTEADDQGSEQEIIDLVIGRNILAEYGHDAFIHRYRVPSVVDGRSIVTDQSSCLRYDKLILSPRKAELVGREDGPVRRMEVQEVSELIDGIKEMLGEPLPGGVKVQRRLERFGNWLRHLSGAVD